METTVVTQKQLKEFGLVMGFAIAVLFGCLIPYWRIGEIATKPMMVAGIFIGFGLLMPKLLKPIYQLWMKIGTILGWINSRILLGILFYGLIAPIGLVLRLIGKRLLLKPNTTESSYCLKSFSRSAQHMERPY